MGKAPTIPYCTVKAFRACLEMLRAAPPAIVDRESLVARGMSPHAVYPVLGALRYLAIIDDEGALTANVAPFLDPADLAGRREVLERSYAAVLADVSLPVDEREDVDRLLIERHDVATGVAAFCATFFLWLAAESGIPVAEGRRVRRGRPPAHLAQLSEAAHAALLLRAAADPDESAAFIRRGSDDVPPPLPDDASIARQPRRAESPQG